MNNPNLLGQLNVPIVVGSGVLLGGWLLLEMLELRPARLLLLKFENYLLKFNRKILRLKIVRLEFIVFLLERRDLLFNRLFCGDKPRRCSFSWIHNRSSYFVVSLLFHSVKLKAANPPNVES